MTGAEDLSSVYNYCAETGVRDADPIVIANTWSAVRCIGAGNAGVYGVFNFVNERAQDLRDLGQPVNGDLHITARQGSDRAEPPVPYAWPPELSLADYFEADVAIYGMNSDGYSKRVSAMEAAPLRQLRERYLDDIQRRPLSCH